jgi:hypothetical protein
MNDPSFVEPSGEHNINENFLDARGDYDEENKDMLDNPTLSEKTTAEKGQF